MSEGLNMVMLFGNLGADPELRTGANGTAVLKLRLATNHVWIDKEGAKKESTEWHRVVIFGKRAEALASLLTKGERLFVQGRMSTSSYDKEGQKHYSTEVIASDVMLAGRGAGASRGAAAASAGSNGAFHRPAPGPVAAFDDVPF